MNNLNYTLIKQPKAVYNINTLLCILTMVEGPASLFSKFGQTALGPQNQNK